jgi:hypothetical protein
MRELIAWSDQIVKGAVRLRSKSLVQRSLR